MPVKVPDDLPAAEVLRRECVMLIPEQRAFAQDIRALRIAVANIMPIKHDTEVRLLRLLSSSPLQVEVVFIHPRSYVGRNTPPEHLARFYRDFATVQDEKFDCLIITGAPVETLAFEQVVYWDELRRLMDWSRTHVYSTLYICWGAQAGLWHHFGVPKHDLPQKMFGVFSHRVCTSQNPLLHGFDDIFSMPHSRHTEIRREDLLRVDGLTIAAESDIAGLCLVTARDNRMVFVTGHPEYDQMTLRDEFLRDQGRGLSIALPVGYFPNNNPTEQPMVTWRSHSSLFFSNWLRGVYQSAPFDLNELQPLS